MMVEVVSTGIRTLLATREKLQKMQMHIPGITIFDHRSNNISRDSIGLLIEGVIIL
jgi:hypothetical protein